MIRQFFERRRIRNVFSKLVSSEVIDDLLNNKLPEANELREAEIGFVLVSVRGETSQIISERMGVVSDLATQHGGTVHDQISGIVVIAYGILAFDHNQSESRPKLCESLVTKLGQNIKIVQGAASGHCGLIGGKFPSFSFIVPGFLDALAVLAALPYGEVHELQNK